MLGFQKLWRWREEEESLGVEKQHVGLTAGGGKPRLESEETCSHVTCARVVLYKDLQHRDMSGHMTGFSRKRPSAFCRQLSVHSSRFCFQTHDLSTKAFAGGIVLPLHVCIKNEETKW